MISDSSGFPALVAFDASQLLGLSVKLLDLPSKAAHILYDLQVVLSHLVSNDIIRALRRRRIALLGKLSPYVEQENL
jgi:hypothetical protein